MQEALEQKKRMTMAADRAANMREAAARILTPRSAEEEGRPPGQSPRVMKKGGGNLTEEQKKQRRRRSLIGAGVAAYEHEIEDGEKDDLDGRVEEWKGPLIVVVSGTTKEASGPAFVRKFCRTTGGSDMDPQRLLIAASHEKTHEGREIARQLKDGATVDDRTIQSVLSSAIKKTRPPRILLAETVGTGDNLASLEASAREGHTSKTEPPAGGRAYFIELTAKGAAPVAPRNRPRGWAIVETMIDKMRDEGRIALSIDMGDGEVADWVEASTVALMEAVR